MVPRNFSSNSFVRARQPDARLLEDLMDEGIHDRLTIATTSFQVSVPS